MTSWSYCYCSIQSPRAWIGKKLSCLAIRTSAFGVWACSLSYAWLQQLQAWHPHFSVPSMKEGKGCYHRTVLQHLLLSWRKWSQNPLFISLSHMFTPSYRKARKVSGKREVQECHTCLRPIRSHPLRWGVTSWGQRAFTMQMGKSVLFCFVLFSSTGGRRAGGCWAGS